MDYRQLGSNINQYDIKELIGEGGFAVVHRARCRQTHLEVAIKIIDKTAMQESGMVNRVKDEVSIHSRLRHPSVLELFKFFEDSKKVYLVLELCHNGDLQKYLNNKSRGLPEAEASQIIQQVAKGIRYLHSHNIMHRDISLKNLLLTKNMAVKIADFGMATELTKPNEQHLTMCGTPNFISPEVASRISHSLEADVWGLGCVLYTILVGKPPFDGHAVTNTLKRVMSAHYTIPEDVYVSSEARDLIHKLLQKNPKNRIGLLEILDHPFIKQSTMKSSHDSGMYTMSSKRDSTFNDSSLQKYSPQHCKLQQMSDYFSPDFASSRNGSNSYDYQKQSSEISRARSASNLQCCCPCKTVNHSCCSFQAKPINFPPKSNSLNLVNQNCYLESAKRIKDHPPDTGPNSLEPLTSYRLLPTRHETKNVILHILESGEVCLEFLKKCKYRQKTVVSEVCRISQDGSIIVLYQPEEGRGALPKSNKHIEQSSKDPADVFCITNFPSKHWKKYIYATKFVGLVKAKTPKITFYSDKAKCLLMENLENREALFYEGEKVIESPTEGFNIIDKEGHLWSLKNAADSDELPKTMKILFEHAREVWEHCLKVEKTLGQIPGDNFPIIIGRRPSSSVNNEYNNGSNNKKK